MSAFVQSDFDPVGTAITDPRTIDARRLAEQPFRKMFKLTPATWHGMSLKIPVRTAADLRGETRDIGGGLGNHGQDTLASWNIVDSDFRSFTVAAQLDLEQMRFDDATRNLQYYTREMDNVAASVIDLLDQWYVNNANGVRAIVAGITKTDGTTAIDNTVTQAIVTIDRTAATGSLGRIRKGQTIAFHAATSEVPNNGTPRIYAKVIAVRGGHTVGSTSKKDLIYIDSAGVTQVSRSNGTNAADATGGGGGNSGGASFANIAATDAILGVNTYGKSPYGIDAYAAGTATIFGIAQATVGNEFSKPLTYSFGANEFSTEALSSVINEAALYVVPAREVASLLRVHPGHFRSLESLADAGVRTVRPMDATIKGPIAEFGWSDFVYMTSSGRALGLWIDPMQNYNTIDLMPTNIWQEFTPPNVPSDEWLGQELGGGIPWSPSATVVGTTATRNTKVDAFRIHHGILFCSLPENWIRITGCTPKAYA